MHTFIAFLAFLFGPSDDWMLKQGFGLVLDPRDIPAVVQSYGKLTKSYPTPAHDATFHYFWTETLSEYGFHDLANKARKQLLKREEIEADLVDDIHLKMGESAFKMRDYKTAREMYAKVIEKNSPHTLDAKINWLILALAEKDVENTPRLANDIKLFLENKPESKRSLFPLGLAAYSQGAYQEAIDHFSKLDSDPKAIYFKGLAHRHLSQPHPSVAAWNALKQKSDPYWTNLARFQLAESYFDLGDENLSQAVSEEALTHELNEELKAKFHFRLASIQVKKGNYEQALEQLAQVPETDVLANRALTLKIESTVQTGAKDGFDRRFVKNLPKVKGAQSAYQTAWIHLYKHKFKRAIEQAEEGLEDFYHKDFTPQILLLQALSNEHLGNQAEALATYQVIADRFPNSMAAAKATHWTLLAYNRLGRHQEAVTHTAYLWHKLSNEVKAQYPESAYWLGESHKRIQRFQDANQYYAEFLSKADRKSELRPHALFQNATVLAELNKNEAAVALLDEFHELGEKEENPAWIQMAQLQKGHIQFNTKNFEQAIAHYRASDQGPKALYYEGLALSRLEYYTDAVDTWTRLAQAHPEHPLSEQASFKAARTQFELGQTTHAVTAFAQFIETYPQSPLVKQARLQVAHAHYNANQFEEAAKGYEEYLSHHYAKDDLVAVTPFLTASYVETNKPTEQFLGNLRGKPPTELYASYVWNKGAEAFNGKKYKESQRLIGELLASSPETEYTEPAIFYLGESSFMQKKWKDAEDTFNHYLRKYAKEKTENQPLALFHKGITLYQQRELIDAANVFESMALIYPEEPITEQAKQNLLVTYHDLRDWKAMKKMQERYNIPDPFQEAEDVVQEGEPKRRVYPVPPNQNIRQRKKDSSDYVVRSSSE